MLSLIYKDKAGSTKANGREPKSCLYRVFNYKLGCFDKLHKKCIAWKCPLLELKTRPKFSPDDLSLSKGTETFLLTNLIKCHNATFKLEIASYNKFRLF